MKEKINSWAAFQSIVPKKNFYTNSFRHYMFLLCKKNYIRIACEQKKAAISNTGRNTWYHIPTSQSKRHPKS